MKDLTKLTNDELLQGIDPCPADVGAEIIRRLEMNGITYRREDGERIYPTEEELNEMAKLAYMRERPEIFGKNE